MFPAAWRDKVGQPGLLGLLLAIELRCQAPVCLSSVLLPDQSVACCCLQMEATRAVARRLVAEGLLEILQKGAVVDPHNFKGPIRLRLKGGETAAVEQQGAGGSSSGGARKTSARPAT